MAKDSSFDVVSQVDIQEVDNAFGQAKKEIAQRYDLKDSGASISLDKANKTLQEVIAFLKEQDYGQPLQFTNYR